ncbi:hypothetical protein CEXT_124501 [Caerostris extrusa]|uniref:Uncharacterized protein n=1 Tax=Caerostris extrusa TaxID=172846 RepID=A0AAV4NBB7_CAEEX|nr:hypothetical protein CEXT_124501 [Caerostris extrusa]
MPQLQMLEAYTPSTVNTYAIELTKICAAITNDRELYAAFTAITYESRAAIICSLRLVPQLHMHMLTRIIYGSCHNLHMLETYTPSTVNTYAIELTKICAAITNDSELYAAFTAITYDCELYCAAHMLVPQLHMLANFIRLVPQLHMLTNYIQIVSQLHVENYIRFVQQLHMLVNYCAMNNLPTVGEEGVWFGLVWFGL